MQFARPLFTLLNFLAIFTLGIALPLTNKMSTTTNVAITNSTVIHRLGSRDVVCEPVAAHTISARKCRVFSLAYEEDGTNFIAGFDSGCTPISTVKNAPTNVKQLVDIGHKTQKAIVWFYDWKNVPRVRFIAKDGSLGNYGSGVPDTFHCEKGNNDDTGLYCITQFPC
jgi:hypothetical protein